MSDSAAEAEAKPSPSSSDLVAQKITNHRAGCDCLSCWGIRTGFDVGYASGMSNGVASGRAQAATDIRADRGSLDGLSWRQRAAGIAEGSQRVHTDRDESLLPASTSAPDPRAETEDGGAP
jgi:hypothetical protein